MSRLQPDAPGGWVMQRAPFHAVATAWILSMLLFARYAPDAYAAAMQEDRLVEWWTVGLFLTASVVRARDAIRRRQVFDALVAIFCLFVAGEEISWGQRVLGFVAPVPFLSGNTQQEFNLHNFADLFGKPKWVLAAALVAYGVILPLVARLPRMRAFAQRLGATIPPLPWMPWFAIATLLLAWYPVEFTGEWVECLAGALFLVASPPDTRMRWRSAGATLVAAALLTRVSEQRSNRDPTLVACAMAEVVGLARDLEAGDLPGRRLRRAGSVHKRLYAADAEGFLDASSASMFESAECAGIDAASAAARRRYLVDPWGTAYWMDARRPEQGHRRIVIYSFGPNRRRDGKSGEIGARRGDDITAVAIVVDR